MRRWAASGSTAGATSGLWKAVDADSPREAIPAAEKALLALSTAAAEPESTV